MSDTQRQQELKAHLEGFGDARNTGRWHEGNPDYVDLFSLTREDIPQLIEMARFWIEREDWPEDENDFTVFAPVHAWRALAQLRATEAIPLLLDMTIDMDKHQDSWHLEEFPQAFALIGTEAIPPLEAFLKDTEQGLYVRTSIAHGLCEIAQRHEKARDQVVDILSQQLEHYARQDVSLNAFLISYLLDLRAVESTDVIERAFADDCVDVTIGGNWNDIRSELGVEGSGLVSEELANQRVDLLGRYLSKRPVFSEPIPIREIKPRQQKKNLRQQRKRQRQNRKKARR